jgi:hypothetical protein
VPTQKLARKARAQMGATGAIGCGSMMVGMSGGERAMARQGLGVAGAALVLAGCVTHTLTVPEPLRLDQALHPVRTSAIGWGTIEDVKVADKCRETNSITDVQVRTSFWASLASVLSLGLWQPADIRYRCGKRPTTEGAIPP